MDNLSPEAALDLLINGMVAHVGIIDGDVPYVSPVSYVIIDNKFCFRTGAGRRVNALRANPAISVEVMRAVDGGWECVIGAGTARAIDDDVMAQRIVSGLLSKYSEQIGSPLTGGSRSPIKEPAFLYEAELSDISGRSSGSWFSIPTRPGRL